MNNNIVEYLISKEKEYPDKNVYCGQDGSFTYSELLYYASCTATAIAKKNVMREPIVVFLEKSVRCLACFWGIAYSGNYYTPIDIDMPIARIEKIIMTLKPKIIITISEYAQKIGTCNMAVEVLLYEQIMNTHIDYLLIDRAKKAVIDTDLLYVLFTSGSTGNPKGVTISHRAVIDFAEAVNEKFDITEKEILGNQGPFYFDLSVLDLYCTVFAGATMYIIPTELFKFPVKLLEYINEKSINTIYWVPSALVMVANLRALRVVDVSCLRKVMFCGEVMPNKQLNVWRKYLPDAMFVNMYGPTETTCASSYYIVDREFEDSDSLPIGFPFRNTDILVLNEQMQQVQRGEVGELGIRGTSVSNGYYRDAEKTKEVFIQNPLNSKSIDYIYMTGDMVSYNEYGELIYLSRKDFQIKHMGHRIELGEIETSINSIKGVTTCCCVYDDKKNKIAIFLADKIEKSELMGQAEKNLPEYMIPDRVYYLEELPHNANGKIDRNKLKQMLDK